MYSYRSIFITKNNILKFRDTNVISKKIWKNENKERQRLVFSFKRVEM